MKILIGVDDDPLFDHVLNALRWCVRVDPQDQVIVVYATPVAPWMRRATETNPGWSAVIEAEDEKSDRVRTGALRQLSAWGIGAECVIVDEHPAKALLRVARERAVDLIVLGARGHEERGFLVGSVSQKVKTLAKTDVLVVKRGAPLDSGQFRALLAVDGSAHSLAAVESFARKTRAACAEVHVVYALDLSPLSMWDVLAETRRVDLPSLPPQLRQQADEALASATRILQSHGIAATTEVHAGTASVEILVAAQRHRAHLVVMGSRGLSGIRGLLLGSVTQRLVRHGATSVFIGRQPEALNPEPSKGD